MLLLDTIRPRRPGHLHDTASRAITTKRSLVYRPNMCRALAYLGKPVALESLIFAPDSSLVRQTYAPRMLGKPSLAGFGMAAWDETSFRPNEPFVYRTTTLPSFDPNLHHLTAKLRPSSLIAHVRGVPLVGSPAVGPQNLHPFRYPDFSLAMAHNGDLARFDEMKFDLLEYVKPEIAGAIRGTTDSEWIYALLMSQLEDPTADQDASSIQKAVEITLSLLRDARTRRGIEASSSVNLFLCDGNDLFATRFAFDYGRNLDQLPYPDPEFLSLWYTIGNDYGRHDEEWKMIGGSEASTSAIVASEPLTSDVSTWVEVPEYSMLSASLDGDRMRVEVIELDA